MKSGFILGMKSGGESKLIPRISHCILTLQIPRSPHCVFHLTPHHLMVNLNLIPTFTKTVGHARAPSYDHLAPTSC